MHISLAIATIGRRTELTRLLESLCNQTHKDFSVLICDQNPEGFLDETLVPFQKRLQLTVMRHTSQGVSAARNVLLPYIAGDIVTFPDDDCWYAPNTLEQVVAFFAAYEHVGSIMGVWSDYVENVQIKNTRTHPIKRHGLFNQGGTLVQFYRRKVIDAVGNFDEKLGPGTGLPYGCGEDTDYILRAAELSEVWRVPSVQIFHAMPNTQKPNKEKVYTYALGRMYLLRKHNFPLWFKWANILFPLYKIFAEKGKTFHYRWSMFWGRLQGLF